MSITEHLDRIERPLESCEVTTRDPQLRRQCREALESLAAIREQIAEMEHQRAEFERDRDERLTALMESAERWEAKCVALTAARPDCAKT